MADPRASLTIVADVQRARDAFARVGLSALTWIFTASGRVRGDVEMLAIRRHGPRNFDPVTGRWQSDLCSAWLCGSCPTPDLCDHGCHGRTSA